MITVLAATVINKFSIQKFPFIKFVDMASRCEFLYSAKQQLSHFGEVIPQKALPENKVNEITLSLLKFKALSWLIQSVHKGEFKEKIQSIFKMIHAK
jgi:hypothetical protein